MSPRIALVTCEAGRPRDDDLAPLVDALERRGIDVATPDWDDDAVDWTAFDLAVIRSTWDYVDRHDRFVDWAYRVAAQTQLVNPPRVVQWSSDKTYLLDLQRAGARVVPTQFVTPADSRDAAGALPVDVEFVVKPTVSAGSRDTVRYHANEHDAAARQIRELGLAGRSSMVQPYQRAVDTEGEMALLFFGGEFSHAIRKGPLLTAGEPPTRALFAEEHITAAQPNAEQLAVAQQCLASLADVAVFAEIELPLAYARVDVLVDNEGRYSILELELVEPSLFFAWSDGGADRYATVLVELAGRAGAEGE